MALGIIMAKEFLHLLISVSEASRLEIRNGVDFMNFNYRYTAAIKLW
ncbi:hypothetical protein LYNGBM3L_03080 [Moorena producens 3L]|uniref:Uncharacterized protein n=1 Tax=Moorena producens 3L TaxID=489825 RepID=F4XIL4_9CYAN|nr:hypothetical protein LYNGBM3L_03080 [Moorena producens 3L]